MNRTRTTRYPRAIALALAGITTSIAFAQVDDGTDATNNPNAIGIFVRDSATAAEKLNLAQRMERAQEWDTSASVYQEVVDRFADRVIATHTDAQGRADRYGGVAQVVQDRIAAWPAAGQRAYLNRYEAPAAQMLAAVEPGPDDVAALSAVLNRYFLTTAGRDAALRLLDRYFENGEFVAAASLADRLIDKHPGIDAARRPMLLLRAALAWHLAGDAGRAQARADVLARDFPDAHATLGGVDRKLNDLVHAELARSAAPSAALASAARWTQPFGTPDHAAVAHEPIAGANGTAPADQPREWARLLTIALDASRGTSNPNPNNGVDPATLAAIRGSMQHQRELGAMTGILPAVDGDALFFQDNAHVYARSLTTGGALPGWQATYPNDDGRFSMADAQPTPRGAQMSVTLAGRYVLGILAQPEPNAQFIGGPGATRGQVVCLDRNSGAQVWSCGMADMRMPATGTVAPGDAPPPQGQPTDGAQLQAPNAGGQVRVNGNVGANDDAESLRACNPCGSVLVVNDAAYFVARGGMNNAIIDTFLVCLDLNDGSVRWSRHLASGNSMRSQYGFDPNAPLVNAASSHLAYADGRIYACTDLGGLAAVNATDGSVAWIAAYPRPRPDTFQPWINQGMRNTASVEPAFAGNPVIVRDGKVITLPVDSDFLFVHDAIDGRELTRVRLKTQPGTESQADTADVLAGVNGDRVVVASRRAVTLLDWSKIVPTGPTSAPAAADDKSPPHEVAFDDATVRRQLIVRPGYEDGAIRGRVCITDHSVFVPTAWRLLRLDLATLVYLDQYPANDDWSDRRDESPGNVTVVGDDVLVSGPNRISVFSELSHLRTRLDALVAADPNSIAPRVQYADALFNAGREDEALTMIDAATQRLGDPSTPHATADRAALFGLVMNRLRERAAPPKTPDAGDPNDVALDGSPTPKPTPAAPPDATPEAIASQQALLKRADALASSADQQVAFRLASATVAQQAKDFGAMVARYQEILDEPAYGAVRVRVQSHDPSAIAASVGGDAAGMPAGMPAAANAPAITPTPAVVAMAPNDGQTTLTAARLAARSIDRALDLAHDDSRAAYAPVEARAADAFAKARAAGPDAVEGGPAALFAIARQFPNAQATKQAVALAGEILTRPGGAPADRRALRELAARAPDSNARTALSEAMLRSDLAQDDAAAALGRARRLAWQATTRPFTTPLPATKDGTALADASTAGAAVDALQKVVFARAEHALPDLHASLAGNSFDVDHTVESRGIARLLWPADLTNRGATRPGTRTDRLVALGKGPDISVQIFKPGEAQPVAKVAWPGAIESGGDMIVPTWLAGDRLLLRQADRIGCVDVAGSRVAWTLNAADLDRDVVGPTTRNATGIANAGTGGGGTAAVIDLDERGVALLEGGLAPATGANVDAGPIDPFEAQLRQLVASGQLDAVRAQMLIRQRRMAVAQQQQIVQQQVIVRGPGGARLRVLPRRINVVNNGGIIRNINGQILNGAGQLMVVDENGNLVPAQSPWQADAKNADDVPEQIVDARVPGGAASDLIVLATSRGRLLGVDAASGAVRWRATVGDRAPSYVGICDDRVLVATTDEQTSQLVVVDALDGSEAMRRQFGDANSTPTKRLMSIALSDEGFAVVVQGDAMSLFDIAGGDPDPLATQAIAATPDPTLGNGNPLLQNGPAGGARSPQATAVTDTNDAQLDPIQFCAGRVLVLSSVPGGSATPDGSPPTTSIVRAFDLGTLQPITAVDPQTHQSAEQRFIPAFAPAFGADRRNAAAGQIGLRVHKDRLFIDTGYFFKSYPVLDPTQLPWTRTPPETPSALSGASPMLVRDGVVVIGWPREFVGGSSPAARLELYSRQSVEQSQEVGMLAEEIELSRHGAGRLVADAFQPVDGGIYYLGTDGVLVFLPGKSQ